MRLLSRVIAALPILLFTGQLANADPHPPGFSEHRFNPPEQRPTTDGGVTTFVLSPKVCSHVDYGDGRGETDCKNGNVRSVLIFSEDLRLGESVEYRFDVRVDPSLAYKGFRNIAAVGIYPDGIDSHLRIASWEGPLLHNFIYMLKVDTRNGIDFLARQCQSPKDFGKWVTFSLKTQWTRDDRGWVKVACDDVVIYADEGIATNQAPHCWQSNQCEPWVPKDPGRFNFVLGPVMSGFGPDWQLNPGARSIWDDIQPEGITIQVRNIGVTKGAKLYDEADMGVIKELQGTLAALGCDPGPVDGIAGRKTRAVATACRKFSDGVLPAKLTVATARIFLDAYRAPGVADLAAGVAPAKISAELPAAFVVHAAEEGAQKAGRDVEANSNIMAKIQGAKKGEDELFFIILGRFDYNVGNFGSLEFVIIDNLKETEREALAACQAPYITFPDGTDHAHIRMRTTSQLSFAGPTNAGCIISALPRSQAAQVRFMLGNFRDIAVGMVREGTIDKVRHEGVKIFLRRVALGEVLIDVGQP